MTVSVDQFGKAAVTSGLMSPTELKALWAEIPADKKPPDGPSLAAILRQRGLLNDFQADELLSGRDTPLVLNQYVLVAKIGAGGMGQVFKAQHRKMKRLVAIKLLPSSMTKDEAAIKRFQREVEAAAKLTHPNIVAALDADECRGMHYLVMEYVEGQDLSAVVKKQGPLAVEQAIDYILQAARGLAYAHAEGVVHRDIKPANLLVDKKGVVKILDMGLARIDGMGEAADHQLTNTGQVMGTVDYMAPEQATDTRMADARSDVYSLGCSLYRLLTGGNVYDGDTLIKKIMSHMHDPIPSLRAKRPDVPAELDRIFAKMMAKKPEDRYQQTSQLVTELEALRSPGGAPSQPSVVEQDSELQRFLSGVKDSKTHAPTATKLAVTPASQTNVDEATAAFSSADATTDPKSEVIAASAVAAQKAASGGRATRAKSSKSKSPPIKLIATGALGVVLVLLGIVVVVRDKDGNKVVEVNVPPGGSVEVKQTPPTVPAKAPTPPANTSTTSPKPLTPSPVTGSTSATDFALHLKDRNDGVEAPNPGIDLLRPFTVEAYITPGTIPASGISDAQIVGMNGWRLDVFKSGWSWYCYHSTIHAPAPIVSGRRVHLAGVRTLNQLLLYVDGKLVASKDEPIQAQPDPKPTPLRIAPSTANFLFKIDELRITQGTPYTQDFTPPARFTAAKDTLLLYHFDEGQGNVVNDSSGKNLHGKLTGGQWVRVDGNSPSTNLTSSSTSSEIDLLAGIDVNRDAVLGKFTLAGGLKQTDNVLQARIQLPTSSLPAEYDLHYTVARTAPGGKAFMIGFVSQGKQGSIVVDGFSNPPAWGVEMIDGKSAKENGTYQPGERVTFGSPHKIEVRVRNDGVTALCDDAVVVDWKGKASQLSTHAMWDVPRKDQLFVGFQGPYVLQAARLIPASVSGAGAATTATNVVYLDELTEKSYFGLKDSFVKPGRNPSDAASSSRVFPGAPLVHALHVHPDATGLDKERNTASAMPSHKHTSRLVYDLDGEYALFQSGFRSRTGSSSLQAEVWGDGRPLWQSGVPIAQHPADTTAEVDVRGIRELTLFTWCDDGKSHVLLTEPRLTPVAPVPLGNSPGAAAAGVVYLDDLQEIEWKNLAKQPLGKHGKYLYLSETTETTILFRGKPVEHTLWMHPTNPPRADLATDPTAFARYQLDGRYATFAAEAGIHESADKDPASPVTFRLLGDGRELWKSQPMQKRGESAEVAVDIRGVKELRLETASGERTGACHATWFMPRLTPVAPVPLSNSPGAAAAGVVYLDDLQEIEWKDGNGKLGKHGLDRVDIPFTRQGKAFTHALFTHPLKDKAGIVRYALDGKFATLAATVGLADITEDRAGSAIQFRVLGDGRELWKSHQIQKPTDEATFSVSVVGVRELQLEVATLATNSNKFAHAVWLDPRLTPIVAPSTTPGGSSGAETAGIVYLDDLPEKDWRGFIELGKHGDKWKQDGSVINWQGTKPAHALTTYPLSNGSATVTYELGGRYSAFQAVVGITVTPRTPLTFRVSGDGKILWESPPQTKRVEAGVEVNVDLRGVETLKLEVLCPGDNNSAHAVWINPRLTPATPSQISGVVYLDDLPELEFKVLADRALGKHGKYRDQGKDEETILWRGQPVTHSLWMHPPRAKDAVAFARYQLEGKYQTFAADAGIQENMIKDPVSPVVFRVLGDDRELWKSPPLQKRGESVEVSVDVRGVKELRLEASSGEKNGNCHATWFMPRLTPVAANPRPWSLVETKSFDGELINKVVPAGVAVMSHDGLAMVLPVGAPDRDLAISTRATLTAPWSVVQNLGPQVNSQGGLNDAEDAYPAISQDQNTLVFFSKRGKTYTLWMAVRQQPTEPFGAATKLGPDINETGGRSIYPSLSANGQWLTFTRGTAQTKGFIAQRTTSAADFSQTRPLGPAIDALGTPAFCAVANDGLSIVMVVYDGAAGVSPFKLWTATRQRPDEPFTNPIELGAPFRGTSGQFSVTLSGDGQTLWCVQGKEILRAVRTALNPTVAVVSPSTSASSPAPNAFDRQVAQKLLDFKLPVKLKIAGKTSFVKPGSSLPVEPFVIEGIDSGAFTAVPREELVKLLGEFRQLTSVENTFLPMKDCNLWAETFAAMPSIKAVVAARCDELTDVGAGHLARLPKLEYLNIGSSVKLTATGLAAFEACKTLTTIELCPEAVTAGSYTLADIQKLQNALPKTRIVFGGVKPIPGLVKPTN